MNNLCRPHEFLILYHHPGSTTHNEVPDTVPWRVVGDLGHVVLSLLTRRGQLETLESRNQLECAKSGP